MEAKISPLFTLSIHSMNTCDDNTLLNVLTQGICKMLVESLFPTIIDISVKKAGKPLTIEDLTGALQSAKHSHTVVTKSTVTKPRTTKDTKGSEDRERCDYRTERGNNPGQQCKGYKAPGFNYCNGCINNKSKVRKLLGLEPKPKGAKGKEVPAVKAPVANVEALVTNSVAAMATESSNSNDLKATYFGPEALGLYLIEELGFVGRQGEGEDGAQEIFARLNEQEKLVPLTDSERSAAENLGMAVPDKAWEMLRDIMGEEGTKYF